MSRPRDLGNLFGLDWPLGCKHKDYVGAWSSKGGRSPKRTDPSRLSTLTDRRYYEKKFGWGENALNGLSDIDVELFCLWCHGQPRFRVTGAEHLRNLLMYLWPDSFDGEYTEDMQGRKLAKPVPKWLPAYDMMCRGWCDYEEIAVAGHSSASKTYLFAHILLAELLSSDPGMQTECPYPRNTDTRIIVTSTEARGLRDRLFGDMVKAIPRCSIPIEDKFRIVNNTQVMHIGMLYNGKDRETAFASGFGLSSGDASGSKVRGRKALRLLGVFDEAENAHMKSFLESTGNLKNNFVTKFAFLANPNERHGIFGTLCEPEAGWASFDMMPAGSKFYRTKTKGVCLALDGREHINVKLGRAIVPGAITSEYAENIRSRYGEDSIQWQSEVCGEFPRDGTISCVIPSTAFDLCSDYLFDSNARIPIQLASFDPAFDGKDEAVLVHASLCNSTLNLEARESISKTIGKEVDIDHAIAKRVMRYCQSNNIKPKHLIVDTTGAGRSILSALHLMWSTDVQGFQFGGSASDRIMSNGERANKMFDAQGGAMSEVWWSLREFLETRNFGNLGKLDSDQRLELLGRKYEVNDRGQIKVEPKKQYRKRLGKSPDTGDALALIVELAKRLGVHITIEDKARIAGTGSSSNSEKTWWEWADALNVEPEW